MLKKNKKVQNIDPDKQSQKDQTIGEQKEEEEREEGRRNITK